jgi:hypothetical protein
MIFVVQLKEFDYFGELFNAYCLNNSFSLEKAEIEALPHNKSAQIAYRIYKLLIGLSNVKLLALSCNVLEVWLPFFVISNLTVSYQYNIMVEK